MAAFKQFIQMFPHIASAMQSGGKSSAMKPVLLLVFLSLISIFIMPTGIVIFDMSVKALMGLVFCLLIVVAIGGYCYLLKTNPRMLQSEHYQIIMKQMDMEIAIKGKLPEVSYEIDSPSFVMNDSKHPKLENEVVAEQDAVCVGTVEDEK